MKKFFFITLSFFLIIIIAAVLFLSSVGYETSRFNKFISQEIKEKDPNIEAFIKKIKIKLDLKKFNLFLTTSKPKIIYQKTNIPIEDIKVYFKVFSLLEAKPKLNRVIFKTGMLKIKDIQKISLRTKPSNFKSFLLNNLVDGKIVKSNFDLTFDDNFKIKDFKINGKVNRLNAQISKEIALNNVSFNFAFDKNLVLLNSVKTNFRDIVITNGVVEVEKKEEVKISGKFNSNFNLENENIKNLFSKQKFKFLEKNSIKITGTALQNFDLKLSNTLKVLDYDYSSTGKIEEAKILFKKELKPKILDKGINKIEVQKTDFKINFNKKDKNLINLEGNYKTNDSKFKNFKFTNNLDLENSEFTVDFDLSENIFIDLINFKTNKEKLGSISSRFILDKNGLNIESFNFSEENNLIEVKNLKLNKKNQIYQLKNIKINTFNDGSKNNDFEISFGKKF